MGNSVRTFLLLGIAATGLRAGEFLVVTRSSSGVWSFQDVESISVNGKDKVRIAPLASAPPSWDPKVVGHLPETQFSTLTSVRRAADGALLGRGASPDWQLLLPDGLKSKTAETAAQMWSESTVTLKKDRKDKSPSPIRLEELYAIVPGQDAAVSAAALATELAQHKTPGVSDEDAFRSMLSLIPAAVKAYPSGPAADRIRDFLRTAISVRLTQWQEGGAQLFVLDESLALAGAAQAAFPKDATLAAEATQAREVRKWLDRRLAILRALDAGEQSDAFLVEYRAFEIYDKSFPQLSSARQAHLRLSAKTHIETARRLRTEGDYAGAVRHLLIAKWRDPKAPDADEMLEQVRLEAARLSSQKFAEGRRGIDPRSPAQVQLQRRLLLAEQYLNDGKLAEGEKAIQDAEVIDKDEPRVLLLQARLAVARGDLGMAMALLDNYDGIAVTSQDFTDGEKLRAQVQYTIETSLAKKRSELDGDLDQQRFATALETSADGLKLDNENPDFLYYAGLDACVLRHCDKGAPLLRRYLDLTDSTEANRQRRVAAVQLLREAEQEQPDPAGDKARDRTELSWFSGSPLERGALYDPVSLAFQPKVAHIEASDHLNVNYEWAGNALHSVHAKYEAKKTGSNILRVAGAAAMSAGAGVSSTVGWRTADRETNDFYFNYYDDVPQVLKVSRDNVVTKSTRIPITIPGVPIAMGGFGALGALGSMGSIGSSIGAISKVGSIARLSSLGGMGAMPGLGGFGGSGILSRLAGSGRMSGLGGFSSLTAMRQIAPSQNYSVRGDPQGGSSAGFLTLWNSPRLDTRLAYKATGKRAAVGFSGNRYFHPFVWDGIHLFELDYDDQGRVQHAWEIGDPGAPRLDLSWEGKRLVQVSGHDSSGAVVYSRTLNYNGERLTGETITHQGGSSRIEYKYDKQGRLVEADCDADHSLDGRSRKVHFVVDDKGKG
ncbi:MAG TPA: hypothetical protein VN893_25830 [Bryobacteraceae bacterium]|nr:hypothetical protein [Bryobacteraceae bacterium]